MNNGINFGDIQPSCSQIGRDQNIVGMITEFEKRQLTILLFKSAMKGVVNNIAIVQQFADVIYCIAMITENNHFFRPDLADEF